MPGEPLCGVALWHRGSGPTDCVVLPSREIRNEMTRFGTVTESRLDNDVRSILNGKF